MQTAPPELARSVLESAPDAIIIVDAKAVVRFANRQVMELFGYSREAIVGKSVELLVPERFREGHVAHRQQYAANPRMRPMGQNLELYGRRRDQTEFPVEISLSPVANFEELLIAAVIRDVSDSRQVRDELLAARVSADHAKDSADRANRAKSRLLATASHDLCQPLQTLTLLNAALRRVAPDPAVTDMLTQQAAALGVVSRLLSALLDMSKIESGVVKPQSCDFAVSAVFDELKRSFLEIATAKDLRLEIESTSQWVRSDPLLVDQILKNLLSNAIKYTSAGRVALRCLTGEDTVARLEVIDTGIGIPADQLACIYDEFYQVTHDATVGADGYGLGLSIVKRLVELLGAKIEVHSQQGKGSTFALLLPVAEKGSQTTHLRTQSPENGALSLGSRPAAHVLVVDDDQRVNDATCLLLRAEGYQITPATSLKEAVQAARQSGGFDLILTDYHLRGDETGSEVIKVLRQTFDPRLPAILLTGDTSSSMDLSPSDPHLRLATKPISAAELLQLLSELLQSTPKAEVQSAAPTAQKAGNA